MEQMNEAEGLASPNMGECKNEQGDATADMQNSSTALNEISNAYEDATSDRNGSKIATSPERSAMDSHSDSGDENAAASDKSVSPLHHSTLNFWRSTPSPLRRKRRRSASSPPQSHQSDTNSEAQRCKPFEKKSISGGKN